MSRKKKSFPVWKLYLIFGRTQLARKVYNYMKENNLIKSRERL